MGQGTVLSTWGPASISISRDTADAQAHLTCATDTPGRTQGPVPAVLQGWHIPKLPGRMETHHLGELLWVWKSCSSLGAMMMVLSFLSFS